MKIAFVTLAAGEEFSRMAALVNPAKRRYCSRFGYDFISFDEILDTSRPPAWSKIPAIQRVLPNYDWLFWCDTDAVLWSPDAGLRQFIIAAGSVDAVFQPNQDGANSGLFFLRNCAWSFDFLEEIYRQEQFIHHPWWEKCRHHRLALARRRSLARSAFRSAEKKRGEEKVSGTFFLTCKQRSSIFCRHGKAASSCRGWVRVPRVESRQRAHAPVRR